MKLIVCMSLFLLGTSHCFASETEYKTIKSVINAFEQSIQAKDKSRFLNLFVDPSSPMMGVVSEESMITRRAAVAKINKEDNKNFVATRFWASTPEKMIDRIASEDVSSREVFDNIKITTDGNIAHVYFDYVYYQDNKKKNWGSESWQMVQTLKGWKISSVSYSITFL